MTKWGAEDFFRDDEPYREELLVLSRFAAWVNYLGHLGWGDDSGDDAERRSRLSPEVGT